MMRFNFEEEESAGVGLGLVVGALLSLVLWALIFGAVYLLLKTAFPPPAEPPTKQMRQSGELRP